MESPCQSSLLARAMACGAHTEQVFSQELCCVVRTHAGAVLEGLSAVEGCQAGAGEQHEEEGAAERCCYGLTVTPHSLSPLLLIEGDGV